MIRSLGKGFSLTLKRPTMIAVVWLVNLVSAGLASAVIWLGLVITTADHVPETLSRGAGDGALFLELMRHHGDLATSALFVIAGIGALHVFSMQWMAWGITAALAKPEQLFGRTFWGAMGSWFWPAIRLLLFTVPLMFLVSVVVIVTIWLSVSDWSIWMESALILGVLASVWFLVGRVLDYVRIHAVLHEDRGIFITLFRALWFTLRRFYTVWPIALFFVLLGALAPAIAAWSEREQLFLPAMLAVTQISMIWRAFTRCALIGAELSLYTFHHPPRLPVVSDGQPPVRRTPADTGFWERNPDLDKELMGMGTQRRVQSSAVNLVRDCNRGASSEETLMPA